VCIYVCCVHDGLLLRRQQDVGEARIIALQKGAKVHVQTEGVLDIRSQLAKLKSVLGRVAARDSDVVVVHACSRVRLANTYGVVNHVVPILHAALGHAKKPLHALYQSLHLVRAGPVAVEHLLVKKREQVGRLPVRVAVASRRGCENLVPRSALIQLGPFRQRPQAADFIGLLVVAPLRAGAAAAAAAAAAARRRRPTTLLQLLFLARVLARRPLLLALNSELVFRIVYAEARRVLVVVAIATLSRFFVGRSRSTGLHVLIDIVIEIEFDLVEAFAHVIEAA